MADQWCLLCTAGLAYRHLPACLTSLRLLLIKSWTEFGTVIRVLSRAEPCKILTFSNFHTLDRINNAAFSARSPAGRLHAADRKRTSLPSTKNTWCEQTEVRSMDFFFSAPHPSICARRTHDLKRSFRNHHPIQIIGHMSRHAVVGAGGGGKSRRTKQNFLIYFFLKQFPGRFVNRNIHT